MSNIKVTHIPTFDNTSIEHAWHKDMLGRSGLNRLIHDLAHARTGTPHRWGGRETWTREFTLFNWNGDEITAMVVEAWREWDPATQRTHTRIQTVQRRYATHWLRYMDGKVDSHFAPTSPATDRALDSLRYLMKLEGEQWPEQQ